MAKNLANILHLILCHKDHKEECQFYIESQHAHGWEEQEHLNWVKKAEEFITLSGKTEQELELLMSNLVPVIGKITFLKTSNKELTELIDTIVLEGSRI